MARGIRSWLFVLVIGLSWVRSSATEPNKREKLRLSPQEQKVLDLTNAERKQAKLPPLTPNATLFKVARAHSANMARQEKMDHNLDGKLPKDRVNESGYKWRRTGENIAYGDVPIAEVMKGWMDSKHHRENILNPYYTEIGIGVVRSMQGLDYYTQVFGTPAKKQP